MKKALLGGCETLGHPTTRRRRFLWPASPAAAAVQCAACVPFGFTARAVPRCLQLDEIPVPVPGAGEVRIALRFAGVNFIDTYFRSGLYDAGPLPARVGKEGAGVVTAVGEGVGDGMVGPRVGDRVAFWNASGSYADEVLLPAARALPLPDALSFELGAALPLQGMTAHYLVHGIRPVVSGDTVLIHAAAGGVGLLACQLAKRAGARVFGTCSTPAKAALARAAGCDEVILYTETSFADAVLAATAGQRCRLDHRRRRPDDLSRQRAGDARARDRHRLRPVERHDRAVLAAPGARQPDAGLGLALRLRPHPRGAGAAQPLRLRPRGFG